MKVALTGATGFLGGAIARQLVAAGHDVHALVRPTSNRQPLADLPITWTVGDITQAETMPAFLADAEWVIHAAGLLGKAGVPEAIYHQVNCDATRNLFQLAANLPALKRIIYLSSAGILGPRTEVQPAATFNETAPLRPTNRYERSKVAAEKISQEFIAAGLPLIIVRPEFVYGPGDHHVLGIFQAIKKGIFFYIGDGKNTCHPTFVDDLVAGVMLSLQRGTPGEIYHLTGPKPISWLEFAGTIAAELDVTPPWLHLPPRLAYLGAAITEKLNQWLGTPVPLSRSGVDFFSEWRGSTYAKARKKLEYEPKVELAEGVGRTIKWYQQEMLL